MCWQVRQQSREVRISNVLCGEQVRISTNSAAGISYSTATGPGLALSIYCVVFSMGSTIRMRTSRQHYCSEQR
jgi:hypothetical protein